jgi:UDP-galactopyranose mutase
MSTPDDVLTTDLVCFSHLRWDFVYQRPQHLLSRFAQHRRVFVVEEPVFGSATPHLEVTERSGGITLVVPQLLEGTPADIAVDAQRRLLVGLFETHHIQDATFWYYTAMAMAFTRDLPATRVVYDCMDELAAFKNAPPQLLELERELFHRADHVFTGGVSLYEAKKSHHPSVHAFPSSIDAEHFAIARGDLPMPADLAGFDGVRVGFCGVIDERADLELIEAVADLRAEWQFVMVGPVAKIEEASLPRRDNIHYLGARSYDELPAYLAHFDVAMIPFARNDSTRFISPTKTPEYLAAGKPVVSTPIADVVRPYGEEGLVHIAASPAEFVAAIEAALRQAERDEVWRARVDDFLAGMSWDATWSAMAEIEHKTVLMTPIDEDALPALGDALRPMSDDALPPMDDDALAASR